MSGPVLLAWSGGKDSCLTLAELRQTGQSVAGLLTTVTEGFDRVAMHGVRRSLLEQQAASLGLPLHIVWLPQQCSNNEYDCRMQATLEGFQRHGISSVAFGDLFLDDIRQYRIERLSRIGMTALFPMWGCDTRALAREFYRRGYRAVLTCVDTHALDAGWVGKYYDEELLRDSPAHLDPCGENGEFHTFVFDGPVFSRPVTFERGDIVWRDRFVFCDLVPSLRPSSSQPKEIIMNKERFFTISALILGAAVARLLPHPSNVTPMTALAVFGGMCYRPRWVAFTLPLGAMLLSDCLIGFHALMPVVYGSFALVVALAAGQRQPHTSMRVAFTTATGSVLFYLTTNFAVWTISGMYPRTLTGLLECYLMGLPFLRNALLGDLAYSAVLFGALALLARRYPSLRSSAPATA